MQRVICRQYGFSLIELSIVLLVIGLLLAGMMTGLSNLIWHAKFSEAKKDLSLTTDALIGYVISNGGLPCPDTDGYHGNSGSPDGMANAGGVDGCDAESGYLPWRDLGLKARDPWNNLYFYRIDTSYAKPPPVSDQVVTFLLTEPDGNIEVRSSSSGSTIANNIAAIFFSVGPNGYITTADSPSADEDENLDDDTRFVDKAYVAEGSSVPEFDDVVHWLSSFVLKSKMVEAKRLPE